MFDADITENVTICTLAMSISFSTFYFEDAILVLGCVDMSSQNQEGTLWLFFRDSFLVNSRKSANISVAL